MAKIDAFIAHCWQNTVRDVCEIQVPTVDEFVEDIDRQNKADTIPTLDNWLAIYDQFVLWFLHLNIAFHSAYDEDDRAIAYFTLVTGTIVSHLMAIRRLVMAGFDIEAKKLLRSLCEHTDLLNLMYLEPQVIDEFHAASEPEAANRFWHARLSKGKARKKVYTRIRDLWQNDELVDWYIGWRKEEDTILSISSHPSQLASWATMFAPGARQDAFGHGFLGAKTEASIRTLHYAVLVLADFLLITGNEPFSDRFLRLDLHSEPHRYVLYGSHVLLLLVRYIFAEQDSPDLKMQRPIDHMFESDKRLH